MVTQQNVYTGIEEIKNFFSDLLLHFPKQKSSVELEKITIRGELIYIVWHGKTPSLEIPFASDTFIIKNGKIQYQTFASELTFVS